MSPESFDSLEDIVARVVLSEEKIQNRVRELGATISEDYRGEKLLVIGILRGAFIFMADLIRYLDLPLSVDFMLVSSYENRMESSGVVRIIKDTKENIQNRHVLIVEDIIDSGWTYHSLKRTLSTRDPASLKICSLLNKKERREVEVDIDYFGFDVADKFLVGYGLDFREEYRQIPYIFEPTPDALDRLE